MIKRSLFFVCLLLLSNVSLFAFEYKVNLREKCFKKAKYNFSILKVVDGRLNKQKPIGFIVERIKQQLETMWVGQDSLGESMTAFFKPKQEIFDTSLKIMVVLNQCNLRHIYGHSNTKGNYNLLEIKTSFDYYKLTGNAYELIYQQYFIHTQDLELIRNAAKAVNIAFSETVKLAMDNFNKQLALKEIHKGNVIMVDSLLQFLYKKHAQQVTAQNIKDGIYFSCKDLYLNKPSVFKDFSFDTSVAAVKPLSVKTNNYILEKAYAIVSDRRIFIFINEDYYKEALLSDDGVLYFPDVSITSIPRSVKANAADAVGVATAILPIGFLGELTSAITRLAIIKAGVKHTKTDVIVDFETSDLEYRN